MLILGVNAGAYEIVEWHAKGSESVHNGPHWHAGHSAPGCLPNEPYSAFSTFQEAIDFLIEEIEAEGCTCFDSDEPSDELCEVCLVVECFKSGDLDETHGAGFALYHDVYEAVPCKGTYCGPEMEED